jgi:predicted membrane GTPase involved in stress response
MIKTLTIDFDEVKVGDIIRIDGSCEVKVISVSTVDSSVHPPIRKITVEWPTTLWMGTHILKVTNETM